MPSKYFYQDIELRGVQGMDNKKFELAFPGVEGKRYDGFSKLVGEKDLPTWDPVAKKWQHNWLPVERIVEYKSNPSMHACDARCLNATGKIMRCECSCGGKNHGRGFSCSK